MTEAQRIETGAHVAVLDVIRGAGVLVAPAAGDDVSTGSPVSLHHADWDALVRRLVAAGWTLVEDHWGEPMELGRLPGERRAYGLYPRLVDDQEEPTSETEDCRYLADCLDLLTLVDQDGN